MTNLWQDRSDVVALAPMDLRNGRVLRYHGDDMIVSMETFVDQDQRLIRNLYEFLQRLFENLKSSDPTQAAALEHMLRPDQIEQIVEEVIQLGSETYRVRPSPILAKTIHDLRGGGLSPLLGHLQLGGLRDRTPAAHDLFYFLTRDHLKIMRNALIGLDDDTRDRDLEIKLHGTDLITQKWDGAHLSTAHGERTVRVDCPQSVEISECCVEFGAFDRILYNLFNNACRHAADETIRVFLLPVPETHTKNLRVALLNALTPTDRDRLQQTDLTTLFQPEVSTTGSGYGLNIAADFVARAYGLASPENAVAEGYLGAKILRDRFVIWFHWPIVADV